MQEHIEKAIKILNQGGVIIYPTDTAFGIGCRIDNEKAVERLFSIRKRPHTQATPVLVGSIGMAGNYLKELPDDIQQSLLKQYWPGALTVVLPCKAEKVPSLVRGGTETIGVRMPNHDTALAIIRGVGLPVLGPSANFHGEATPYEFSNLNPELTKLVDYVVPGECQTKLASTVIDCTVSPWRILRQGAVQIIDLRV